MSLAHLLRPAGDDAQDAAQGALVLFHGRATDEHDLYPLLDALDPERRLLGVTVRGPLSFPPGGAHWYAVRQIGFPDSATFLSTYAQASRWLDDLLAEHAIGLERTVLGGFSQGAVMSYALGLGADRPRPGGIIALSGFIPTVDGFELGDPAGLSVAVGHGTYDPVIGVEFGRAARDRLVEAGAEVTWRESPMGHSIDPDYLDELRGWLSGVEARA
jgi:phospholipase/carboxylesterase